MAGDPVCGMDVDEQKSKKVQRQGRTYHFCSDECMKKFQSNPEQYTTQASAGGKPEKG